MKFVISKANRAKYFEFIRSNDEIGFAKWLENLSNEESERMEKFIK
ncbi:MAG: hypothetical protein J6A89_03145 [Clostridia bacterium]|nr:hypothetical protein [Clostridia bacterium]